MKKRYQIFISSTFADLKDERKMVMHAVLERKCFPAGMELFPAIDKKQFDYIKKVIDDSDYYLLIIGARYGSMDNNGVSYTEKEYDYAVKKGIPVIAFLHNDIKSIPLAKADVDKVLQEKLESFRSKVQNGRLVNYWENAHDLKAKVISSLVDVFEDQPKVGWVRTDIVASADAQKKIDKLQKEIRVYKTELKSLRVDLKKKEVDCVTLEKSNKEAQQEIKNLQETINQLQKECDELRAKQQKFDDDRLAFEKFSNEAQEKVNHVVSGLEKILGELKGNNKPKPKTLQLPVETITIPGTDVSFKMVRVDGGTFRMGANEDDDEALGCEKPAHQVTLSDYYIGETQVTQALWQAVMGDNPSGFNGDLNCPVEKVSWKKCQEFIKELNRLTGLSFRLPTEAQWEFAARGGNKTKGYKYAGSDNIKKVAWYDENSEDKTHPVGEKDANELGLFDMSGNVWEWCQDRYDGYTDVPQTDPEGPESGSYHVNRGGGWDNNARYCRVSDRYNSKPTRTGSYLGLRLAL